LTEDGATLFAACRRKVIRMDTRTGAAQVLLTGTGSVRPHVKNCLMDVATRSLILSDFSGHRIVRLRVDL
jgi:hypothetical protein